MRKSKHQIQATTRFQRELKKTVKGNELLKEQVLSIIEMLSINPFYRGLRTHTVNIPSFGKVYSSRVTEDLRIIWNFNGDIIVLQRIGGHSGSSKIY
jgi:mRNA-degrading endonuclease YafQ of YafQ-DinJ toxin-antitoxin module